MTTSQLKTQLKIRFKKHPKLLARLLARLAALTILLCIGAVAQAGKPSMQGNPQKATQHTLSTGVCQPIVERGEKVKDFPVLTEQAEEPLGTAARRLREEHKNDAKAVRRLEQ